MVSRRKFLAGSSLAPVLTGRQLKQWNILWLSCEDSSPHLGCYGDKDARTPHLDKLAAQGQRFTHAFSTYGVCAPSRSSIITGMYPATIGTHHMRSEGVPPPHVKCFTEWLRAAGYYCTNAAKTDYNFAAPVTAWDESNGKAHWRGRESGQPFFSVINITSTHESQIWTEKAYQHNISTLSPAELHDPAQVTVPPIYPDTPTVRKDLARLHDNISSMDKTMGGYLKQLEDDGLADSTIVFFWGDHGDGLTRSKRWVYDSGTKVPLIIRWPGQLKPASVSNRLVSLMDLGPTVLSLAGIKPPDHMQGQAFLGAHAKPAREYCFMARDRMDETYDCIRSVRDKRFRYIRNYQPEKTYAQDIEYMNRMPILKEMRKLHAEGRLTGPPALFFRPTKPKEELFDSEADPWEINDLAQNPKYAKELARLRAVHERFMKETGDLGLVPEPELKERMRPGGQYVETAAPSLARHGALVTASCATPGASIAYSADGRRWNLYSKPVPAAPGMRFKACRLGYKDSVEVTL
jgi:uncharacterized sulfatase